MAVVLGVMGQVAEAEAQASTLTLDASAGVARFSECFLHLSESDCVEVSGPSVRFGMNIAGSVSPGWWDRRSVGARLETALIADEQVELGSAGLKLHLSGERGRFVMDANLGPSLLLVGDITVQAGFDTWLAVKLHDRLGIGAQLAVGMHPEALVGELYAGVGVRVQLGD